MTGHGSALPRERDMAGPLRDLRVLLVEDSARDADLIFRELRMAGVKSDGLNPEMTPWTTLGPWRLGND